MAFSAEEHLSNLLNEKFKDDNNNEALKKFRQTLRTSLHHLQTLIQQQCSPEIKNLFENKLTYLLSKLPEINREEEIQQENKKKLKKETIDFLINYIQLYQTYTLNYINHLPTIDEQKNRGKDLSHLDEIVNKFSQEIITILKIKNIRNQEQATNVLWLIVNHNFSKFNYQNTGRSAKTNRRLSLNAVEATAFSYQFAQIVGAVDEKNKEAIEQHIKELEPANKDSTGYTFQSVTHIAEYLARSANKFAHDTLSAANNTVFAILNKFSSDNSTETLRPFYEKIAENTTLKVNNDCMVILKNIADALCNTRYHWLSWARQWLSNHTDHKARQAGNRLNDLLKNKDKVTNAEIINCIRILINAYEVAHFSSFSIKKMCLKNIEAIAIAYIKIKDITSLIDIYYYLPKSSKYKSTIFDIIYKHIIYKKFPSINTDEIVKFLEGLYRQENLQHKRETYFKEILEELYNATDKFSTLMPEQCIRLITLIKNRNEIIETEQKSFFDTLFGTQKFDDTHKVKKEFLDTLQTTLNEKIEPKNQEKQQESILENSINQAVVLLSLHNQQNIDNRFLDKEKFAQLHIEEKILVLKKTLDKLQDQAIPIEIREKIEALIRESEVKIKEKQELAQHTKTEKQQDFYTCLMRTLSTILGGAKIKADGSVQTVNIKGTTSYASAFLTLVSKIPVISLVKTGIDWAAHKQNVIESATLANIILNNENELLIIKKFSIAVTKLLNNHPIANNKIDNIKSDYLETLANTIAYKIVLAMLQVNISEKDKIDGNYETYIQKCLDSAQGDIDLDNIDINRQVEKLFGTVIRRTDDTTTTVNDILLTLKTVGNKNENRHETQDSSTKFMRTSFTLPHKLKKIQILEQKVENLTQENQALRNDNKNLHAKIDELTKQLTELATQNKRKQTSKSAIIASTSQANFYTRITSGKKNKENNNPYAKKPHINNIN